MIKYDSKHKEITPFNNISIECSYNIQTAFKSDAQVTENSCFMTLCPEILLFTFYLLFIKKVLSLCLFTGSPALVPSDDKRLAMKVHR